jgi:ketosteroid isomerase-like protein
MSRRASCCVSLFVLSLASLAANAADTFRDETVISLERGAMDRWGNGDPNGFLEIYAPGITYFDPGRERRIDGIEAMTAALAPIKGLIMLDHYDMIAPSVYHDGNVAVLSYNLVTYGKGAGPEARVTRWNVTAAYALIQGKWKIVHHHFSITKPA